MRCMRGRTQARNRMGIEKPGTAKKWRAGHSAMGRYCQVAGDDCDERRAREAAWKRGHFEPLMPL